MAGLQRGNSLYQTSLMELQQGFSGSGLIRGDLASMNLEEVIRQVNMVSGTNNTSSNGGGQLSSAISLSDPQAMASLLAQGSQSYMGALQMPSDMRGKTVEEVWSSLATVDLSTASAATSELQLKPRDSANLLEMPLGPFLEELGVNGANSLRDVPYSAVDTSAVLRQAAVEEMRNIQAMANADSARVSGGEAAAASRGGEAAEAATAASGGGPLKPTPSMKRRKASQAKEARAARMQGRKRKVEDEPVDESLNRLQERKVKNRESAARSRNRKQQYTDELELEVQKLTEENEELKQQVQEKEAKKGLPLYQERMTRLRRTRSAMV